MTGTEKQRRKETETGTDRSTDRATEEDRDREGETEKAQEKKTPPPPPPPTTTTTKNYREVNNAIVILSSTHFPDSSYTAKCDSIKEIARDCTAPHSGTTCLCTKLRCLMLEHCWPLRQPQLLAPSNRNRDVALAQPPSCSDKQSATSGFNTSSARAPS